MGHEPFSLFSSFFGVNILVIGVIWILFCGIRSFYSKHIGPTGADCRLTPFHEDTRRVIGRCVGSSPALLFVLAYFAGWWCVVSPGV